MRCKYVFVEFEQVFATWSYTKKVSKFWKISNLIVLGSFTYVENDSEVVYLKRICENVTSFSARLFATRGKQKEIFKFLWVG